jgi:hypothetical protein
MLVTVPAWTFRIQRMGHGRSNRNDTDLRQVLAGLGGNDPHSSAVTVPCASMNTLDPYWYDWRDLNPQSMKRQILSLLCIPFHHSRVKLVEITGIEPVVT